MKKSVIGITALVVLAAGGAFLAWRTGYFETDQTEVTTLFGNVEIRTVDLAFRVGGRIAEVTVDEGARVAPGDVLARLDPVPLQQALAAAEAQVALAKAALDKAIAGSRPREIDQAKALVDQRRAALDLAELALDRDTKLRQSDAISQVQLDAAKTAFREAKAMLSSAEDALSLLQAGTRAEDVAAANAAHSAALAARDQAKTAVEDATLVAVQDGFVMTRARERGAIVGAGATVLVVAIDRPVFVRAYAPEPMLGDIMPGRAVEVTTDSSDKVYDGTIGFVSPVAEFTPKSVQTPSLRTDLVFRFRVTVNEPDAMLRQGMPVTVRVPEDAG